MVNDVRPERFTEYANALSSVYPLLMKSLGTPSPVRQFLDLFTYEWMEVGEQNNIYHNCVLLKPMGRYQVNDRVDAIAPQLQVLIWQGDELTEDTTVVV